MLADALMHLYEVRRCAHCFHAFQGDARICVLCRSASRNHSRVMIVEKDMDFLNIEKSGIYDGVYHIVGGVVSPVRPQSQERLRLKELYNRVQKNKDIKEVILATSATPEGDHTARYIEKILEPFVEKKQMRITRLARGLSTGSELEYSDAETFKGAYLNRK